MERKCSRDKRTAHMSLANSEIRGSLGSWEWLHPDAAHDYMQGWSKLGGTFTFPSRRERRRQIAGLKRHASIAWHLERYVNEARQIAKSHIL